VVCGECSVSHRHGLSLAAQEHIVSGEPITRLEAMVLFGIANLPDLISELRKQGWRIESRRVPFARALKRLRETLEIQVPDNLPIREIVATEYWLSK